MKGYWHFAAVAAACSFFTLHFQNYIILIAFLLWLYYLYFYRKLGKIPLIASLLSFFLFFFYFPDIEKIPGKGSPPVNDVTTFTGEIVRPISVTEKRVEVLLQDKQTASKLSVVFFPDPKQQASHPPFIDYPDLRQGALCEGIGREEIPPEARNPGQFDVKNYLAQQGISRQIVLSSKEDITCEGASFVHRIYLLRSKLTSHILKSFSEETAGWLNALVFGDDSYLEEEVIELFQRWGLSHILAISGLHIGIVVTLLYFVLLKLNITTKEKTGWVLIVFLPFYALLAGGAPSVLRASTMVLLFIILRKIKWRISITDAISIVFLLLLTFNPLIIYHVGFQLSFIVTSGLILSKGWISQSDTRIMQVFKISFVSQMMILPLQFAYFSSFQPLSILLNVITVPYFSLFVIPFMFVLLFLAFTPEAVTVLFDNIFVRTQELFLYLLQITDEYVDFPFVLGEMPPGFSVAYYALFLMLMSYLEKNKLDSAFKCGFSLWLVIICLAVRPYFSPVGTVTMLDIGQGDSIVIELPYRKGVFFIDAGAGFSFEDFQPTEKVYRNVIKPYLYSRGINKIDAMFLSHEHIDHIGSVAYMIEEMRVDDVIISEYYELDQSTALKWTAHGTHIKRIAGNESIDVGGQLVEAVAPMKNMHSPNENSLVLLTELGGKRWLFMGDAEVEAENKIMKIHPNLSADILKVGHHGSKTSTDKKFIEQLQPDYSLISVGKSNSYGHPSKEVLETLENEGVHIFRTDEHGAIQFHFKEEGGTFTTYLP